ncbi:MAG: translation initiation factor [Crocinitomicaceae bacterium]
MAKKKNRRSDVVYSTNPDFEFSLEGDGEEETLPAEEQHLKVMIDRKKRKGKEVTLVCGFVGSEEDLKALGKELKQMCGVGGSVKDGEILIQGNQLTKVIESLKKEGYAVKKSGG